MNETKRQELPSGLWVVATPIGNLADLSPRAIMALERADGILCEDTRRTAQLLAGAGISSKGKQGARLERLDAHATASRIEEMVSKLTAGKSLALVTDGGTPGVSDPGSALVAKAHRAGIRVTPIPGPSAITALLSVTGFAETAFAFRGFFPRKKQDGLIEIRDALSSRVSSVFVWLESPKRISKTLSLLAEGAPKSDVVVGKELSKIFEKIFSGNAVDVSQAVADELKTEGEVGEWCFAVQFAKPSQSEEESLDWVKVLECLLNTGVSASEAARQVSQHFGAPRKKSYEAALRISGKK